MAELAAVLPTLYVGAWLGPPVLAADRANASADRTADARLFLYPRVYLLYERRILLAARHIGSRAELRIFFARRGDFVFVRLDAAGKYPRRLIPAAHAVVEYPRLADKKLC